MFAFYGHPSSGFVAFVSSHGHFQIGMPTGWVGRSPSKSIRARSAIPRLRFQPPVACPPWIYTNRSLFERLLAKLE